QEVSDAYLFEKIMKRNDAAFYAIGEVTDNGRLVICDNGETIVDLDSKKICKKWDDGIRKIVG
ncbi:MAG: hypothetical protein KAH93_05110, partial [Candidatus Aenigmarchaeota archaeon]|nr:hypothetical protein [Candidatus Aenigmarchaeota archaeon]